MKKNTGHTGDHVMLPIAASVEARLAAAEDRPNPARKPTDSPQVTPNPTAIDCYVALGQADAAQPGADQHTGPERPTQPSANTVAHWARAPIDKLGLEYQQTKQAFADQTLGLVLPDKVRLRHILPGVLGLMAVLIGLVAAGIVVEIVYGQHAAALLSGDYPDIALAAAIAFALAVNASAFVAGGWLHATSPSIVRRHGVRLACIVAVLIALVAATLGLVVGGYDAGTLSAASGGSAITVEVATVSGRPLVALAYFTIVTLVSVGMAAGHLLLADAWDTRKVNALKAAEAKAERESLTARQQREVLATLCQAFLDGIPVAHLQGRRRVDAYNATFRRKAPLPVADMFDDITYDDTEPVWAQDARNTLVALTTTENGKPRLTLVS